MKINSFFIFHLNLAFSSIETEQHLDVINRCYFPLLDVFSKANIKLGIELSAWTLERINQVCPSWVRRLKNLIEAGMVELIGSGYVQMIGPLVPYEMNLKNQIIGIKKYQKLLGIEPKTVLVNEMAYSNGVAEAYQAAGYKNMVMDGDNLALSMNCKKSDLFNKMYAVKSGEGKLIKLLLTDSIIFQKFQRVAHGELSAKAYMDHLDDIVNDSVFVAMPMYCNDAEIFNFRPGRFAEEAEIIDDEWKAIENLLSLINESNIYDIKFPQEICADWKEGNYSTFKIKSAKYPAPVKKQRKYNLARWAITGRNDQWLNASCYWLYETYLKNPSTEEKDWEQLLWFWSSDHRSHLTELRWKKLVRLIEAKLKSLSGRSKQGMNKISPPTTVNHNSDLYRTNQIGSLLEIETSKLFVNFNTNKGMAIQSAGLVRNGSKIPLIGTVEHGNLESIELGADFFSGSIVIDNFETYQLFSDLQKVKPKIVCNNGYLEISTLINIKNTKVTKLYRIDLESTSIFVEYDFQSMARSRETTRMCAATMLSQDSVNDSYQFRCKTGGSTREKYDLDTSFEHGSPVSQRVSSNSGLPASDGIIEILVNQFVVRISWRPDRVSYYPLITNLQDKAGNLVRLHLSNQEVDDTAKFEGFYNVLSYCLTFGTK